jgi:hypothetical protein
VLASFVAGGNKIYAASGQTYRLCYEVWLEMGICPLKRGETVVTCIYVTERIYRDDRSYLWKTPEACINPSGV